jgi:hypothetical protein
LANTSAATGSWCPSASSSATTRHWRHEAGDPRRLIERFALTVTVGLSNGRWDGDHRIEWPRRQFQEWAGRARMFHHHLSSHILSRGFSRRSTVMDEQQNKPKIIPTGEATGILPVRGGKGKPITVIGTEAIRRTFDELTITQALNSRTAPGVTELVLNPDAHCGYGAPVGCVLVSPTHIYPGPVGVDIKCSMSLLQLDLPADAVADRKVRREMIDEIVQRIPTGPGAGQRSVRKSRRLAFRALVNRSLRLTGTAVIVMSQYSPHARRLDSPVSACLTTTTCLASP